MTAHVGKVCVYCLKSDTPAARHNGMNPLRRAQINAERHGVGAELTTVVVAANRWFREQGLKPVSGAFVCYVRPAWENYKQMFPALVVDVSDGTTRVFSRSTWYSNDEPPTWHTWVCMGASDERAS